MADTTQSTTAPATTNREGATEQAAHATAAAKDQAANVAASAKEQAGAVASTATSEARAVASEAADEAKNLVADARQQLRMQADEQSKKVASLVGDIGSQLRSMANAGETGVAKDLVTGVADQAEQMSRRLGDGGLDRTLEDARRLARNRPGLFLAGAALAGFVVARVARAADTDSLRQAAAPSASGNGHDTTSGPREPQGTIAAASGASPASRPLATGPIPAGEGPR